MPLLFEHKVQGDFARRVRTLARELGTSPDYLMAVFDFETGGTFRADARNPTSGCTGLIQFCGASARAVTGAATTQQAYAALSAMTPLTQLDAVRAYLWAYRGRVARPEDLYMAVLYPAAIGKSLSHILFRRGTTAYRQNAGLDISGNGTVTKAEAASPILQRLGMEPTDFNYYEGQSLPEPRAWWDIPIGVGTVDLSNPPSTMPTLSPSASGVLTTDFFPWFDDAMARLRDQTERVFAGAGVPAPQASSAAKWVFPIVAIIAGVVVARYVTQTMKDKQT